MTLFVTTTIEDTALIEQIADRIVADPDVSPYSSKMAAMIEIILTHCNGTPLDLPALLTAEPASFWHDVVGIARHLDRDTGKLSASFMPRHVQKSRPHP
jgi:hypothetical protein